MKNNIARGLLIMLVCIGGCVSAKRGRLTVCEGERIIYECAARQRVTATYYALSDGTLEFVRILLPDGREFTLPHVISASGARYTDDVSMVWWTKGDAAFVEIRNESGEWQSAYRGCRAISNSEY